jgi:NAD(P)-dependent dehydrogenase (short-subunit alcohol dehydrogenase family)
MPNQKDEKHNRVAWVTGGTGALGSAVALELASAGARVAVTYRAEAEWEALRRRAGSQADSLLGQKVNLTSGAEVARAAQEIVARWGRLDFLAAVAGGFAAGKSWESDDATWRRMMDLNFHSLLFTLRAAVPVLMGQNFGRIVTVSSGAILGGGGAGVAAYAISKGAVRQLSHLLAEELKNYNIHVHCILPGTMDTPANRRAMPKADFSKWVATEAVARVVRQLLGDDFAAARAVEVPVPG